MKHLNNYRRLAIKTVLVAWLLGLFGVVSSAGPNALSVSVSGGQLFASSSNPDTTSITIRVAGPGNFFSQTREESSQASWGLPANAPDGAYRYDVYASGSAPENQSVGAAGEGAGSVGYRLSGRFLVSGGAMQEPGVGEEVSSASGLAKDAGAMLLAIAGAAMPAANAQDLTASSGHPTVHFVDLSLTSGNVWDLTSFETGVGCVGIGSQKFGLYDRLHGGEVMSFCAQGENATAVPNSNSLIVDELGDMSLADGAVFIDRYSGLVGIGTTTPSQEIEIVSPYNPFIEIQNTGVNNSGIQLTNSATGGNSRLLLLDNVGNFSFFNNTGLGGAALTWEYNTDYIGIGTDNPSRRLHVVENNPPESVPLALSNADGKVRFLLTANGQSWTFDNTGNNTFTISRIGTGVNEFALTGNGNLTILGTLTQGSSLATKQDIEAVNAESILDRVIALPIAEWSYKRDGNAVRHVGPMSEDFYQAFGLGHTDKGLTSIDTGGVALAAIQGLNAKLVANRDQLAAKDTEIAALRDALSTQEERLLQMEMALAELLNKQSGEVKVSAAD